MEHKIILQVMIHSETDRVYVRKVEGSETTVSSLNLTFEALAKEMQFPDTGSIIDAIRDEVIANFGALEFGYMAAPEPAYMLTHVEIEQSCPNPLALRG